MLVRFAFRFRLARARDRPFAKRVRDRPVRRCLSFSPASWSAPPRSAPLAGGAVPVAVRCAAPAVPHPRAATESPPRPGRPRRDATERAGGKYGPGRILRGIMYYSRSGQRAGRGLGPNRITQNNVFLHSLPPRTRLATSTLSRSASLKLRYPGLTRINLA